MTAKRQPENDNKPIRGHTYRCEHCGDEGVCCDTSAGGIVTDGVEQYYDLGGRDVLLVGDTNGGHSDGWYCQQCAEEIARAATAPAPGQHTPGPWTAELCRPADGSTQAFHWWIHGPGNWTVCDLPASLGAQTDERTANARLIASAPDLLRQRDALAEACRLGANALEILSERGGNWEVRNYWQPQLAKVRAALASLEPQP